VNRALQGNAPNISGYNEVGATNLQATYEPLSSALPFSMKMAIPPNDLPEVGFWNQGYWGIDVVKDRTYTARFYAKVPDSFNKGFNVSLRGVENGVTYASVGALAQVQDTLLYPAQSNGFQHFEATLIPSECAENLVNGLYITIEDGSNVANQDFWFNIVSLFSDTYNGRENGMRSDIVETLHEMKPSFLRFPGGNNLEGSVIGQRWKWNETIGPLTDRPGRVGHWKYANTDGLGLHEYFEWCEDTQMTPLLAVWDGYSLGGYAVPEKDLDPYVEDVLNELEYLTGNASTKYGSLRAKNGRQEPFKLDYVEIPNEDYVGVGIGYRIPIYHDAI
jgi:alpha-N-arabinofuranosidase